MNSIGLLNKEVFYIDTFLNNINSGNAAIEDVIEHNISLTDAERLYDLFNKADLTL